MKRKSIIYSIATFCLMLFSFVGFAQINTNGGFEVWNGDIPVGWCGLPANNLSSANVVKVTTGAHSGNFACQLINTGSGHKRFATERLHVDNETQYVVSFWVKGAGNIRVGLYDKRPSGNGYATYSPWDTINSSTYQYCIDTIQAANTTDTAEFILDIRNTIADGEHLIVDDVVITAIVNDDFVAAPTVTISGNMHSANTYFASATVTMSADDGASIYYTLDGTEPSSSSTLYTDPFTVTETTTLKAIAVSGTNSSTVVTRDITIINLNPLFFENFEESGTTQMTVVNASGTYSWTTASYGGNTYAYANAHNTPNATETWLITPAITPLNAGGVILSFLTAKNYNGPAIQVKYSTNYNGGSLTSATWTDITSECALSSGSWNWTESGDIEIPGAAPIYFAWVYTGDESSAAAWEVDDIMVLPANAQVLAAPVITATGTDAGADNTFYFSATVSMTAEAGADIYYTIDGTVPTEASTLYSAPLQVTTTTTVKAIAVKENYPNSNVATLDVTIIAPTVETPVFSPVAGTYADSVTFSIACATDNAVIRYTTDGTEPMETSALYNTPMTLTATTTVKAKAFKADWLSSETATAVYTIVSEPDLSVDVTSLSFSSTILSQTFTVSGAHLNEAITLTSNSTHFTVSPTTISNPNSNTVVTVTFDGVEPATGTVMVTSGTLSAQVALTATAQLPAPVITPATATDTLVTVTISSTVADAVIHYTMDGSEPTAQSAVYTMPVVFNTPGTYTLNAIAVKIGWENSDVATGTYVINEPPAPDTVNMPVITPASGIYYAPQTVTIACADADAVIRYTTDGTEPTENSTLYSQSFTVSTSTTVMAKAWKSGLVPSATAVATINFPDQVANIAAFKAAAATNVEKQIMSDVTFVFRSGRFMYVEDNTAALLIYDNANPVITTQYNEGDVIEGGIFGKYTIYQGMVEMVPTHNADSATGTPVTVTPADATITAIKAQYADVYEAKLVHLSDVQFINATTFVQNGDTMAIFNRFNTVNMEINAGDLADVTGFVSYSTNHGYQIYPRGNDDIEIHPVVVMDTVATPEIYVYKSGEFYYLHLTCATDGASMYYTVDGTDPDENSLAYISDAPLQITHYTLKAIAMKEGMVNSAIASYDYNPTGVNTYDMYSNFYVYPNPVVDVMHIDLRDEENIIERVDMFNIYGQLVRTVQVGTSTTEISVGTLATGNYITKITTNKGIVNVPVIKK